MIYSTDPVYDARGNPVTEDRWRFIDMGISAFWQKYPHAFTTWNDFIMQSRQAARLGDFGGVLLAHEGDLKKANFRHSLSFPVIQRGDEQIDSLHTFINKHLPGVTAPDKKGKTNRLYHEFARRYPMFVVTEKL